MILENLAGRHFLPCTTPIDGPGLSPELEHFAAEAIAAGRDRDVSEILAVGMSLLKRRETAQAAFVTSLDNALIEGQRDGFVTMEEGDRDMEAAIADVAGKTRR